jgi:uncharacterized protein YlxW (UPF0749 family)
MECFIFFIGAMVFVYRQFVTPMLFFNPVQTTHLKNSSYEEAYSKWETDLKRLNREKQEDIMKMLATIEALPQDSSCANRK